MVFQIGNKIQRGPRPSKLRDMSDIEASYLGGLIDADGSIGMVKRGSCWFVSFSNNDPELISAVLRTTGCGSIGMYRQKHMVWQISAKLEVYELITKLVPFSVKARRLLSFMPVT